MSLPTAHSYVIENLMENVLSIEKTFLKPNLLLNSLTKTEKLLNEVAEVLSKDELADEILKTEKENIILLIRKLIHLEKASQEKLNWARHFSGFLQKNINTK
jgi:hypothetical protein